MKVVKRNLVRRLVEGSLFCFLLFPLLTPPLLTPPCFSLLCRFPILHGRISAYLSSTAEAEEVYRWVSADGTVHYSSSPGGVGAKPAELPKIKREDFDRRISNLRAEAGANCESHGGLDCSRGPDTDGSVICLDGHKNATLPYAIYCLESRLKVTETLFVREDGSEFNVEDYSSPQPIGLGGGRARLKEIRLIVRNPSSKVVSGVNTRLYLQQFTVDGSSEPEVINGDGPETIEPYGIGDYSIQLGAGAERLLQIALASKRHGVRRPSIFRIEISCASCPVQTIRY